MLIPAKKDKKEDQKKDKKEDKKNEKKDDKKKEKKKDKPKKKQPKSCPKFGGCCFIAGTKVLMANGKETNIEEVKVGDTVKVMDIHSLTPLLSEVIRVSSPIHKDIIKIKFSDGTTNINTFDHSYYVKDKGWSSYKPQLTQEHYGIDAKQLEKGDTVYKMANGKITGIKILEIIEQIGSVKTYNIFTKTGNNYFANNILVQDESEEIPEQSSVK